MESVSSVSSSVSDCSGMISEDDSSIASLLSPSLFLSTSIVAGAAGCLVTFFLFCHGVGIYSSVSLPDITACPWPHFASFAFLCSA